MICSGDGSGHNLKAAERSLSWRRVAPLCKQTGASIPGILILTAALLTCVSGAEIGTVGCMPLLSPLRIGSRRLAPGASAAIWLAPLRLELRLRFGARWVGCTPIVANDIKQSTALSCAACCCTELRTAAAAPTSRNERSVTSNSLCQSRLTRSSWVSYS